jgi:SAM-dependent methyltransferase
MSRREIALQCIDISKGRGLELGPLHSPVVSKEEARISYVDHMSTEGLKQKYKGHTFPLEDIVPVDYVLKNSLKDTLRGKKFDYVVASHVIEHIPDIVRWLSDVASILKDDGILSLVIPDMRFTFDILRNESRPADVIGAYLDQQTRVSSAAMYDFTSEVRRNIVAADVWKNPYADYSKKPKNSLKEVYDTCLENLKPDIYVDSHCFVFTPYSFFNIVRVLIKYDLFDYKIAYFKDTPENQLEFYVSLRKVKRSTTASKLRSIPRVSKPVQVNDLVVKIAKQEAEIARLESDIHNFTTSNSWKATKPLRAVGGTVSNLKKGIRR